MGKGKGKRSILSRSHIYSGKSCNNWIERHSSTEWASYIQKRTEIHFGFEDVNQRKLKEKQSPATLKGISKVSFPKRVGESEGKRK